VSAGSGRKIGSLIFRRCLLLVPVLFGVSVLVFAAGRVATPNPSLTALSVFSTPAAREQFIRERHLDDPLPMQYARWLNDVVHGDFGRSLITTASVSSAVRESFPVTLQLALGAFLITVFLGLGLGTLAALRQGGLLDRVIAAVTVLGVSLPAFWVGILLIQFLAVNSRLLPAGGYVALTDDPVEFFKSMALPWITLAIAPTAFVARVTRARVADEMGRPHVRTAVALGMRRRRVRWAYILRNSLVEPTAVLGVQLGYMLGGVVVIERVFSLPGLGNLALTATTQGDFPVLQATALLAVLVFSVTSLLVDALHIAVDRGVARGT
jgi:peptide/nickel transport system permease protein